LDLNWNIDVNSIENCFVENFWNLNIILFSKIVKFFKKKKIKISLKRIKK
jgi:hypothetical protein